MPISIVFLHGLESGPGGSKAQHMRANASYALTTPELPTRAAIEFLTRTPGTLPADIAQAPLDVARAAIEQARPDVVVGSSFGGGIASLLAARGQYQGPLVLLAPAGAKLFEVTSLPKRSGRVIVLHGRGDVIVPAEDSVRLAASSACDVALWLVDDDHRLKASVAAGLMDEAIAWSLR